MNEQKKYVYFFGAGQTEGNTNMRELLGGKGANLAEMAGLYTTTVLWSSIGIISSRPPRST